MKEHDIADDIEDLVQRALETYSPRTKLYKQAQRVEAWLATQRTNEVKVWER